MSETAVVFADSSALVKFYVEEPGSGRVESILAAAVQPNVAIAGLTPVEITSALVRRARNGDVSASDVDQVLKQLEHDVRRRFRTVELGGGTMARATDLVRRHGLRAADAIQLACALISAGEFGVDDRATLLSSDSELNLAASAEGLLVIDPTRT